MSPSASISSSASSSTSSSVSLSSSASASPSISLSPSKSISSSASSSQSPSASISSSPSPSVASFNYILDGEYLPRPKSLKREFIGVYQDQQVITGKTVRDLKTLTKEVYILSWEMLDKFEVAMLLAIVAKNTPVTFRVDEDNLIIPPTSVLAKIGAISYSILGSSYLAAIDIRLEGVE